MFGGVIAIRSLSCKRLVLHFTLALQPCVRVVSRSAHVSRRIDHLVP